MPSPTPPDDPPSAAEESARSAVFNPLTDDLDDLWFDHAQCWFFPEIKLELDSLFAIVQKAGDNLLDLRFPTRPEWALQAAIGIFRSNYAIHQHVERYGSYAEAARALWTSCIPRTPPTLTDSHIYALLSIAEARLAAAAYCQLAAGYETELAETGLQPDDADDIACLRQMLSAWERDLWRWADHEKATAEKFLLLAEFAAGEADATVLKQTEAQVVVLSRRLRDVEAVAKPYRQGRPRGALSPITRALIEVAMEAGSREFEPVVAQIHEIMGEEMLGVIRFDEIENDILYYTVITKAQAKQMTLDSLRRRLKNLPDI